MCSLLSKSYVSSSAACRYSCEMIKSHALRRINTFGKQQQVESVLTMKKNAQFAVRSLTVADIPQVMDIRRQMGAIEVESCLRSWITLDPGCIKVAVTNKDEIIGTCSNVKIGDGEDDFCFGGMFCVKPEYQNQGIGVSILLCMSMLFFAHTDVLGAVRSLNQVKSINLLKKQFNHEESGDPMQMAPMSLLSHPVVAATYYFSSGRRPTTDVVSQDLADRCEAADARQGTCYEAADCVELGGTPMGRCPQEGVCCIFDLLCGASTSEVVSYFRNPGYPAPYEQEGTCKVRVVKHSESICQIRLEFLEFDLARPVEGNCSQDMLVVTGQNENNLIPKICGLNNGQHYYVDVEDSGAISLHVNMVGVYGRKFNIKVTQVKCVGRDAAPPHCLQYHRGTRGSIKSFNYDESSLLGQGYPNNMDYIICIRKEPGFCSITYQLSSEGRNVAPFAVGALPGGASNAASGLTGPVAAECHDDYVLFTGIRVCSGRVAPSGTANRPVREPNTTSTYILTDSTPGPFLVRFVSNGVRNARGFHLTYRQNPCK